MGFAGYAESDATALAELVRSGEVSPEELVETAVERIEKLNPALNAVVHTMFDQARAAVAGGLPDGPFRGVPFLLKDLLTSYPGVPTTGGSRLLKKNVPDHKSEIVERYERAGLVILGKTNTPELGILGETEPELFGPTRNPWDTDRSPGGSSGGSGAAVAARMVPAAAGGDGGGSIRIPASACGLVGLKPTRGRTPMAPEYGENWSGLTVQHVLTRSIRDTAALLDVAAGSAPGDPYAAPAPPGPFADQVGKDPGKLRIAFSTGSLLGHEIHRDCVESVEMAARICEDLGHDVEEKAPPCDRATMARCYLRIVASNVAAEIAEAEKLLGRPATHRDVEGPTWILGLIGNKVSAPELLATQREMQRAARDVAAFFERYDVFLNSTLGTPPVRIGAFAPSAKERRLMTLLRTLPLRSMLDKALDDLADNRLDAFPNTQLFNMTGQPALSLPLLWNAKGLPIGLQFVAGFGDEATLIRLAAQLEHAHPWGGRWPPAARGG